MGQLTNQFVSQSYQGLLNLANANTGFTANLQTITDGLGGSSPLQMSQTQVNISGTFTVNGAPVSVDTGSLVTTSSFNAYTSSVNIKLAGLDVETGSLQNQINGLATTGSLTSLSSSIAITDLSQNNRLNSIESITGSLATTSSLTSLSSSIATTDLNQNNVIAGLATTSSLTSLSSSIAVTDLSQNNRLTALESATGSINRNGLITTGSLGGSQSITGSLNVEGTITATSASFTYVTTTFETASVIYSSGSNQFGDASNDTQTLFGTVVLPNGPLVITGSVTSTGGFNGNLTGTASYATNALSASHSVNSDTTISSSFSQAAISSSFAQNAISSSHSVNSDTSISSSFATNAVSSSYSVNSDSSISSSFAQNAVSSSHSVNSDTSISSSFAQNALSASYAPVSINTGSFATTGSNIFRGNQTLTGSFNQTGSMSVIGNPSNPGATIARFGDPTYGVVDITGNGQLIATNVVKLTNIENWNTVGSSAITLNNTLGDVYIQGKNATGSVILGSNASSKIQITGSLLSPSITGSLEGTASYATNANSASFAPTIIPNWVATTGSNTFTGFQRILNDLEINSSNPVGTFVNMISTGTTSFLMDSPLTQFQSNGEMLFKNTISTTGSADINFRTENGGDIRFNTNNSGSVAITGSVILSGSAGPELDVKGDVLITGSVILSGSAGIELDVKGDQTNTGSLTVRSGTLEVISNNTTINNDLYLTSSVPGQSNIILGWGENPAAGGAAANQANYTGSFIITGSNNIVTLPVLRPTIVGFNTTATGYISGSNNILNGNNSSIYLNGGSQLFPKTQGNYLSINSNIYLNFTTSSLAGGHPFVGNNLIFGGQLDLNHPSGTVNAVSNILAGGGITSTQNFVTNQRATISNNNVIGGVTLNHISSSINYANNYNNSPININNHLSSSITQNALTFGNNAVFGGSGNTGLGVWVSGSQSSNTTRLISDNIIGGRGIIVSSSFVSSSNSNLLSSLIYGQNLIVSGSHGNTGGSAFLGRFNDATSLHLAQDIVFAVGTGTGTSNRRTGLYVSSNSVVGVSGSLQVTGSVTVNGNTTLSGSSPLQVGTYNNEGVIKTLGGSNWLYRNTDTYNTVVGNVQGLNNGFFAGSEKNMVFNGFFSPFATGSNNVIIQGGGDDFISGSGNIFIGNHNGHAGGSNSILIGATSYSSGSILNDKFELGTVSTARIFHKQGADPLQIGDDTQVTGSLQVSNLPTSTGSFVVTTDNNGALTKAPFSEVAAVLFSQGQFAQTGTLTAASGVSGSVSYDISGSVNGITLVSGSRLTIPTAGVYNIQFSAQWDCASGADTGWAWFKKNGVNIANSNTKVVMPNNTSQVMTVNILETASVGDYYEVAWQNNGGHARLLGEVASGNLPAIPSVITTITQVR